MEHFNERYEPQRPELYPLRDAIYSEFTEKEAIHRALGGAILYGLDNKDIDGYDSLAHAYAAVVYDVFNSAAWTARGKDHDLPVDHLLVDFIGDSLTHQRCFIAVALYMSRLAYGDDFCAQALGYARCLEPLEPDGVTAGIFGIAHLGKGNGHAHFPPFDFGLQDM